MRVLVLSWWGIDEGITRATVLPIARAICRKFPDDVFLVTIERYPVGRVSTFDPPLKHVPLSVTNGPLARSLYLFQFLVKLRSIVRKNGIDVLWCRGAPAGGLGALTKIVTGVALVADSFEPLSQYMTQSATWSSRGVKYFMQRELERLARRKADIILPVSRVYERHLLKGGVDRERLFTLPCVVDLEMFAFNIDLRSKMRRDLAIPDNAVTAIYVGKYGGLYHSDEAYRLYARLFQYFRGRFFLILLTETDRDVVQAELKRWRIPEVATLVSRVSHNEVPAYLSAADFGISTIKSVPAMAYCSPIKNGEYWAADMPVLTTLALGDDAEIIKSDFAGLIFDPDGSDDQFAKLPELIRRRGSGSYASVARQHRNAHRIDDAIDFVTRKVRKRN